MDMRGGRRGNVHASFASSSHANAFVNCFTSAVKNTNVNAERVFSSWHSTHTHTAIIYKELATFFILICQK